MRSADRCRFGRSMYGAYPCMQTCMTRLIFYLFLTFFLFSEICMEHIRACRRRMTRLISGATRYNDTFTNVLYMVTMEKKYPRTLTFENVAGRVGGRVLRDGAAWYI